VLFSAIGISITMLTLLVANPQNTVSQIISFSVGSVFFSIYVDSILICFHNGSSVCIILCILCRPLRCVVKACENLSVYIHTSIVIAKRKCSINDSIKSEYPFIKGVNENVRIYNVLLIFYQFFIVSRFLTNVAVFRGKMEMSRFEKILWEP
jgi:hypothetical protein